MVRSTHYHQHDDEQVMMQITPHNHASAVSVIDDDASCVSCSHRVGAGGNLSIQERVDCKKKGEGTTMVSFE